MWSSSVRMCGCCGGGDDAVAQDADRNSTRNDWLKRSVHLVLLDDPVVTARACPEVVEEILTDAVLGKDMEGVSRRRTRKSVPSAEARGGASVDAGSVARTTDATADEKRSALLRVLALTRMVAAIVASTSCAENDPKCAGARPRGRDLK